MITRKCPARPDRADGAKVTYPRIDNLEGSLIRPKPNRHRGRCQPPKRKTFDGLVALIRQKRESRQATSDAALFAGLRRLLERAVAAGDGRERRAGQ